MYSYKTRKEILFADGFLKRERGKEIKIERYILIKIDYINIGGISLYDLFAVGNLLEKVINDH